MVKRPSAQVIDLAVDSVESNRMYSVKETAGLINLSVEYLRDLIQAGRVEAGKPFGGHFRITGNEVKRLLKNMLTEGKISS
ncbi:MAG: excisionase family DNA-binding protein [SAR202 cluster bacterium]|nr:excisionase family DNA-binding protein [SAR202 cluster bacterium]